MLKFGLTGGIGSGKSTVARMFGLLGIPVFEADAEGRELLEQEGDVRAAVVARFGPSIMKDDAIDRKALAAIVFNDTAALADLNAIIHPAVHEAYTSWSAAQEAPYTIFEAAILDRSGSRSLLDGIIVVSAPEALRIARVMQRDGVPETDVQARMRNQSSEETLLGIADHVVVNDDSQLVIPQVLAIHEALQTKATA
jgi:dephospho-CoA kinase